MPPYAADPAAQPHLSPSIFSVPAASRKQCKGGDEKPSLSGAFASTNELCLGRASTAEKQWGGMVQWGPSASYPVLCSGSRFGAIRRPAARRRSASPAAPFQGLGSSQNKFVNRGKGHRTNFFRAPPRKHSLALGSRAHSLTS
jgi:hypothetical protein